jgi:hypothetical protein
LPPNVKAAPIVRNQLDNIDFFLPADGRAHETTGQIMPQTHSLKSPSKSLGCLAFGEPTAVERAEMFKKDR